MNKFKNISKKKSFWNTFVNEFSGTILITFIIIYTTVFILLGRAGIFNFLGGNYIINGITAAVCFPFVLVLALCAIALIIHIVVLIPLIIHKIKAIYNYTYLPLTVNEIKNALDKNIISSKEDYIKLILDSLRYGVINKPKSSLFEFFCPTCYITFSKEELCSLCKTFEEVFDSPIVIDNDMLSYLNKYDTHYSPFDAAKYLDGVSLTTIREENGKDTTFALYTDGDKYKNILETVDFPLYVG